MTPGPFQIILIVAVIILLFGANRLPRIMGDVAKGIRSFKSGLSDSATSVTQSTDKVEADKTQNKDTT